MKISCCILTYNEAKRIRIALTHAFKWADEVCVIDKGSTDETRAIADEMGAKVYVIPFSKQGHEDLQTYASFAANDWIWSFTPGEVPTKDMIEHGKSLVSDGVDLIRVPMLYYSFGIHNGRSPWSWSMQPRLFNRKRVLFSGQAHNPIGAEKSQNIDPTDKRYILHQTHTDAQSFVQAHADYAINEANHGTPEEAMKRAQTWISRFDEAFRDEPSLMPQAFGWKIYWLMVMLHIWERQAPDIKALYKARAEFLLKEEWK